VLLKLGKVLVVFALVATLGAHWALLQTVAWTSMLADNLQSGSFQTAMARTFDGQHPCNLCRAIAAGKNSEQKNQFSLQKQKLDFPPLQNSFALIAPSRPEFSLPAVGFVEAAPPAPPTPPPRSLFV
jgi:hypothetical protein